MIARRLIVGGGLGLLGVGAAGYAGSLAYCTLGSDRQAVLRPLFKTLSAYYPQREIGRAWLDIESEDRIWQGLTARADLMRPALMTVDATARDQQLASAIRAEFQRGEIVTVARWHLSQSEARIAAARVLYDADFA